MKMECWIRDIIEESKANYIDKDHANSGMNGPYGIKETPLRTTAHWVETFASMYFITKEQEYIPIIKHFADYIKECVNTSANGAVVCMPDNNSHTNGLIGLSWVIDGLIKAGDVLDNSSYFDEALRIYKSQKYDFRAHLWDVIDTDGRCLGKDMAFNHNLWFAVSGYRLFLKTNNHEVGEETKDYFDNFEKHIYVYRSGLLSHFITNSGCVKKDIKTMLRCFFCEMSGHGTPWNERNQIEYERAYHLFSMFALSQLHMLNPRLHIFRTKQFEKMKKYALDANNFYDFDDELEYAYYYNSPAYEYPLVALEFGKKGEVENVVKRLFELHKSFIQKAEVKKLDIDYITLNARIYEIMRFYEITMSGEE